VTAAAAWRLDHAVVVVEALAPAVEAWRAAGFTLTPGGRHDALPTENALVVFADGAYVELLAFRDAATAADLGALAAGPRWQRHLQGLSAVARRFLPRLVGPAGVADAALTGRPLARFAAEARRRGVALAGPVPMARERPDGVRLAWELVLPAAPHVPFFIEDRTPRTLRVPADGPARTHRNGARGIAAVRVRVPDVAAAALEMAALFDTAPAALPDGRALVAAGSATFVIEAGEPAGPCGVDLAGVAALPAAFEAAGVRGASPRE